jgi:hypothetical protein
MCYTQDTSLKCLIGTFAINGLQTVSVSQAEVFLRSGFRSSETATFPQNTTQALRMRKLPIEILKVILTSTFNIVFIYDHNCRLDGWHAAIPNGQTNDWTTGVGNSMIEFFSGTGRRDMWMVCKIQQIFIA